jgi:hypothetical protein
VLFSVPFAIHLYLLHKAALDEFRYIRKVHYSIDSRCFIYNKCIQRYLKCSVRNPTPYVLDQTAFHLTFYSTETRKVIFEEDVVDYGKIGPYETKPLELSLSPDTIRGPSYWIDSQTFRISEESFKQYEDEIVPNEKRDVWGKWYTNHDSLLCEAINIRKGGKIEGRLLDSQNCYFTKYKSEGEKDAYKIECKYNGDEVRTYKARAVAQLKPPDFHDSFLVELEIYRENTDLSSREERQKRPLVTLYTNKRYCYTKGN